MAGALPSLSKDKTKILERTLIQYTWNSKKFKIKWQDAKLPESAGGLNMFCLESIWRSYKNKWIVRALNNPNSLWVKLLNFDIRQVDDTLNIQNIFSWTKKDFDNIIKNINSVFWKECFDSFYKIFQAFLKQYKHQTLSISIWQNPIFQFNNQNLNPPNLYIKKHFCYPILFVDKADAQGIHLLSHNDFNMRYRNDVRFDANFYNKITSSITNMIENFNLKYDDFINLSLCHNMPAIQTFAGLQHKGCNVWSKIYKKSKYKFDNIKIREAKWHTRLNMPEGAIDWKQIYHLNSTIKFDNHLKFFNLLVIKDNLETNTRQVHYRVDSNLCTFCNQEPESTIHLLWNCPLVRTLRREISRNIADNYYFLNNNIPNLPRYRILFHGIRDSDSLKFVFYLNLNRYIWLTKHHGGILNFEAFKNFIGSFIKIQKNAEILTCIEDMEPEDLWR